MNMLEEIKWNDLKYIQYIIKDDNKIYKGQFIQYIPNKIISGHHELCVGWYMTFSINGEIKYFHEKCSYYHPYEYYTHYAKQARYNFEKRTLSKILKSIVNEEFEWYT